MYADYNYYTTTYGGSAVSEADFPRLAARASAHIDKLTFGRAAAHADDKRIKMCCCEICDTLQSISDSGGTIKQSETVGGWSCTYADTDTQSEAARVRSSCKLWLPDEWMYRGVGRE